MRKDYSLVDTHLIGLISAGFNTLDSLESSSTMTVLVEPFCTERTPKFRVIDRRLQALRKVGRIEFNRSDRVWVVNKDNNR